MAPRIGVGRDPARPRPQLRSRGAPARLEPRGLLGREDQPVDPSVTHRVRAGPAGVPAPEARRARRAIAREDPLLPVPVLEVADVEVRPSMGVTSSCAPPDRAAPASAAPDTLCVGY